MVDLQNDLCDSNSMQLHAANFVLTKPFPFLCGSLAFSLSLSHSRSLSVSLSSFLYQYLLIIHTFIAEIEMFPSTKPLLLSINCEKDNRNCDWLHFRFFFVRLQLVTFAAREKKTNRLIFQFNKRSWRKSFGVKIIFMLIVITCRSSWIFVKWILFMEMFWKDSFLRLANYYLRRSKR